MGGSTRRCTLWRARLRASEKPERIFDAVRFTDPSRDRRALDSTILHDAVATGDTVDVIQMVASSEKPERIFDAVRQVVTESGVLATRDRRALDSTILHDAVATGDTVTMISSQIRR